MAEHADKATKLSAAVKILNQDYLAMIKGWIAGAQVNPLQGFIQGFNAITSIFTGGDNSLKNYVTRFGEIENQFNKVKQSADDSQRIFDAYSKMLETVNKDLDALE